MLIDPNKSCPCQSGKKAEECCFSSVAPIIATGARLTSATINASLINRFYQYDIPPGFKATVTLNQPYQLDSSIENRLTSLMEAFTPPAEYDQMQAYKWIMACGSAVEQLSDSLYAVRYHQRQFLFRLSKVHSEQLFSFEPPRGNTGIVINDRPLKAELEAFLFRVTSSMDSLSKVICVANDLELMNYGALVNRVIKMTDSPGYRDLKNIFRRVEKWLKPLKEYRNAIAHDGDFQGFIGISHKDLLVKDAEIGRVSAGNYVIDKWRQLLETIDDVVQMYKRTLEPENEAL